MKETLGKVGGYVWERYSPSGRDKASYFIGLAGGVLAQNIIKIGLIGAFGPMGWIGYSLATTALIQGTNFVMQFGIKDAQSKRDQNLLDERRERLMKFQDFSSGFALGQLGVSLIHYTGALIDAIPGAIETAQENASQSLTETKQFIGTKIDSVGHEISRQGESLIHGSDTKSIGIVEDYKVQDIQTGPTVEQHTTNLPLISADNVPEVVQSIPQHETTSIPEPEIIDILDYQTQTVVSGDQVRFLLADRYPSDIYSDPKFLQRFIALNHDVFASKGLGVGQAALLVVNNSEVIDINQINHAISLIHPGDNLLFPDPEDVDLFVQKPLADFIH